VFRNCTMTGVTNPIQITAWYDTLPESPEAAAASPADLTDTTPRFRDITIENVTVGGYSGSASGKNGYGIFIYGRPESLVKNVAFKNVHIRQGAGMKLNFCEGITFDENCWYAKSSTGQTSTAAGITDVIDEQYQCSYTWNGTVPDVILTDVVLSGKTYQASASSSSAYYFDGGYTITNEKNKSYGAGNSATIKYSKDVQYTILLPAGKAVNAISFTGYSNYDGGSYLKEVNGTIYGETEHTYIHDGNKANFITHTITFPQSVSSPITFTPGGNQSCLIITLEVISETTGIQQVEHTTADNGQWYTLSGTRLNQRPARSGIYISNHKKIMIQ